MRNDFVDNVTRAGALALSPVSAAERLDRAAAEYAIVRAMTDHGGADGCAAALAQEFGDHPETAADRMRWASGVVSALYR
ncbi:hypothetical protein [Spirillospora albida]|uniref:hypothetical protein n=1 Tax=Spirillospora albida TaxID=58123 RepID=UPI00068C545C|nr:hypothetical protein [Spirillospora albida]